MFAQLITKGVNYGVHAFLIQIRDPVNHLPFAGITVGDCGEKMGVNGVDNGWCSFDQYRIPKDSLLDKISQIDDDGTYVSKYESEGKRFAMSIASLSGGRVLISRCSAECSW